MTQAIGRTVVWGFFPDTLYGVVIDVDGDTLYMMDADQGVWEVWAGSVRFV